MNGTGIDIDELRLVRQKVGHSRNARAFRQGVMQLNDLDYGMAAFGTNRRCRSSLVADSEHRHSGLRGLGISGDQLKLGRPDQWDLLEAELDRFVAFGYGQASQRLFLQTPNIHLAGLTPTEALRDVDGVDRVCEVVRDTLAAHMPAES